MTRVLSSSIDLYLIGPHKNLPQTDQKGRRCEAREEPASAGVLK